MALTPNEIDVLLHFNANSQAHHPRHHSPAVGEAINRFLKEGLIEAPTTQRASDPPMPPGYFQLTGRGQALVTMLCDTPLPVAQWADPRTGIIVGGEAVAAEPREFLVCASCGRTSGQKHQGGCSSGKGGEKVAWGSP